MLSVLLILLVTANAGWGLECITSCLFINIPFGEDLRIRADQCEQRVTLPACTVAITLEFRKMQYTADFGNSHETLESIYIESRAPLVFDFDLQCATDTDCVIRDAQKRIDEYVVYSYLYDLFMFE